MTNDDDTVTARLRCLEWGLTDTQIGIREHDIRLIKTENLTLAVRNLQTAFLKIAADHLDIQKRLAALEPHDHVCKTCAVKYS